MGAQLRRTDLPADELRELAVVWAFGNGLAIVAVATALELLVAWRPRLLDEAASADASTTEGQTREMRLSENWSIPMDQDVRQP